MKLADFDFDLPEDRIATRPVRPRTAAKLLVVEGQEAAFRDLHVSDLPDLLRAGDRLVLNNTRVLPSRLAGMRRRDSDSGTGEAKVEVTLLDPQPEENVWTALIKPLRKLRDGETVEFGAGVRAHMLSRDGAGLARVRLEHGEETVEAALALVGAMPLPPYIAAKRPADEQDRTDYQTVFARHSGAVAAPTASLHFDEDLLEAIRARGVDFTEVTLHVGAGTFLPVKVDDPAKHRMHAEWGEVSEAAAAEIRATKAAGGRVIAVGTTALRLIESAARKTGEVAPFAAKTDIFIYPGFEFRAADGLMTNFHLPKSTLMMLVSALMGRERMLTAYAHAVGSGYRFFSYGDASLLLPSTGK
ncbi:tRNA preQ1(34) S-adenosylmethionine ribosyltransferase-isomerase QueA [Mangrovicoccus sp. HB161399]|uniref:tRNA preQ1(34) S-adenosylmethionine ribosyltransferase-isomerase QueA n=1 Tax=Mangrovicoccus sp. HB161399 TaxID=2720392 RepID=UPI001552DA55|nr:tRNA preQ1(34) S-adenosylmethionine ribosyltransferase-isomerase QueA [Mangrovicoccus sp. HB161399]